MKPKQSHSVTKLAGLAVAFLTVAAMAYFGVEARASQRSTDSLPSVREFALSVADQAPPQEAGALRDGSVSLQEYEAAIQRTAACARSVGVEVEVKPGTGARPSSIGFSAPTLAAAQEAKTKLDACEAQHLRDIDTAWALQWAHNSNAQQAAHALATKCIQARGVEVPGGFLSVDDLNGLMSKVGKMTQGERTLFDTYRQCAETVRDELGYPLP